MWAIVMNIWSQTCLSAFLRAPLLVTNAPWILLKKPPPLSPPLWIRFSVGDIPLPCQSESFLRIPEFCRNHAKIEQNRIVDGKSCPLPFPLQLPKNPLIPVAETETENPVSTITFSLLFLQVLSVSVQRCFVSYCFAHDPNLCQYWLIGALSVPSF